MGNHVSEKRCQSELRERAVQIVGELRRAIPGAQWMISRVARQLDSGPASLPSARSRFESGSSGLTSMLDVNAGLPLPKRGAHRSLQGEQGASPAE